MFYKICSGCAFLYPEQEGVEEGFFSRQKLDFESTVKYFDMKQLCNKTKLCVRPQEFVTTLL